MKTLNLKPGYILESTEFENDLVKKVTQRNYIKLTILKCCVIECIQIIIHSIILTLKCCLMYPLKYNLKN